MPTLEMDLSIQDGVDFNLIRQLNNFINYISVEMIAQFMRNTSALIQCESAIDILAPFNTKNHHYRVTLKIL